MNAGCWKRQYCSRQPHGCIRILVRQFAHISLIYGRFQELTRGISLIYMALVLVGKAISGVKYTL